MKDTLRELYETILRLPHEDTPRHMYADELDAADYTDPEQVFKNLHADLIRTQLEAFRLPFCEACYNTGREFQPGRRDASPRPLMEHTKTPCRHCARGPARVKCLKLLHTSEDKRIVSAKDRKRGVRTLADYVCRPLPTYEYKAVEIRRGFVDSISIPVVPFTDPRTLQSYMADDYRGSLAGRIFLSVPLSRVHLSDRSPFQTHYAHADTPPADVDNLNKYGWAWRQCVYGEGSWEFRRLPEWYIPPGLFSYLDCVYREEVEGKNDGSNYFHWIEWACVRMGRDRARLPHIPSALVNPPWPYPNYGSVRTDMRAHLRN